MSTDTTTVTAAMLRDRLALTRARRERLDADCSALALRRVQGDVDAIAVASRITSELRALDEEICTLEDAARLAEVDEQAARAAMFEAETKRLEAEAEAEKQALAFDRERLARLVSEFRTLVKALAVQQASYTSHQHVIYNRRGIDRSDLALLHKPHRMLGGDAAAMLSESWLRQVLAEVKHQRRTEENP